MNSGITSTGVAQITTNKNDITTINEKIPSQATINNKLADKNFVNSSIATNTANFIGTFNSVEELEAYSGTVTNNDYAFVISEDSVGNTVYNRYKYTTATTPASWQFEYALNNSSFTADQWAAINSGATTTNIGQIATNTTTISGHIANKNNPHEVTKVQVGLGNVDNTSDADKPVSTAAQTALDAKADKTNRINGAPLSNTTSNFYGTSDTAAATAQKEVSIPSITTLDVGTIIIVQPTVTSTVANSTLKLNDFDAYSMRYNNAAITTSTDSIVWSANYPSFFLFDGTYWVFAGHGLDSNTTYTMNYTLDAGRYKAGTGTYAVTRYSLLMEKADGTWEKITATNANYSTGTSKNVNTNGFRLNHIRWYNTTAAVANGALIATNTLQNKAASVNLSYSANCGTAPGWSVGDYIYLVGTIGADGLFYLDTTQWWSNTLPNTNDGKLYIRLGIALTATDSTMSFFDDRPIYYHDGTGIKEYKVADNKQDLISDLTTIRSGAAAGATAVQPSDLSTVATTGDYDDLLNKPTIPTVNDATLTIQKNGTNVATFTANSATATTANIAVPTDTNDLTNGAGYQTASDVSSAISTHNTSTTAHSNIITPITNDITEIEDKIPSQASSNNQLADKAFVNSSIATNTANFIGTFNSVADLEAYSGTLTNNDYAFVVTTDTAGNTVYDRYKYTTATTPASWEFEYELNNSSFTANQWAAINSGATTTNIGQIATNTSDISSINLTISGYGDIVTHNVSEFATAAQGTLADTAVQPGDLATVATSGSYNDLTNKPTIPAAQVNSDWNAVSGVAEILNKPTLGTMAAESASDYTPTSGLAAVATSGSYADLNNKPTIPTVNDATITITQGGVTKGSFTLNQANGDTIALDAAALGANTDLSNLTSTGANIGNWSSNVTNCITEIPQDINIEWTSSSLTIKAGSKIYIPNGTGTFNEFTFPSDAVLTNFGSLTSDLLLCYDSINNVLNGWQNCFSGSSAPTGQTNMLWYDTTNNAVKSTTNSGSTWNSGWSLPLALISRSGGLLTNVKNIFNGFGYIGSTVFALPGVKVLVPNGRNDDGSLKSQLFELTTVLTSSYHYSNEMQYFGFNRTDGVGAFKIRTTIYDEAKNTFSFSPNTQSTLPTCVLCGIVTYSSETISYFKPFSVAHAVDYNDSEYIAHCATPGTRYTNLTLGASAAAYTAPADGYFALAATFNTNGYLYIYRSGARIGTTLPYSANYWVDSSIFVSKGDVIIIQYNGTASVQSFIFIYTNGAQ